MSKLLKICMVVAAVLSFTGCYNDFDDPAPAKVWTEADFNKDQIITIKQLKDIYYAKYAPGSTAGLGKYVDCLLYTSPSPRD